jgi:hypothetical protein
VPKKSLEENWRGDREKEADELGRGLYADNCKKVHGKSALVSDLSAEK